jgi:hypothetical protein
MRIPTSLAARIGAVAAAAAIAVTGATAAASASTAAPAVKRIPTMLTVSVAKPVAHRHGFTDTVKGHLTAVGYNLHHLPILLERQGPKGHWHVIRRELTGRHGYVAFHVFFKKSITLRLVFRGNRNLARSTSATVTVS